MSIQRFFDQCPDSVELCNGFQLNWSRAGTGFGQLYFYVDGDTIKCSNECMGKEFIKKVLCDMVDQCQLQEGGEPRESSST